MVLKGTLELDEDLAFFFKIMEKRLERRRGFKLIEPCIVTESVRDPPV